MLYKAFILLGICQIQTQDSRNTQTNAEKWKAQNYTQHLILRDSAIISAVVSLKEEEENSQITFE